VARIDIYEGTLVLQLSFVERRTGYVRGDARIPLGSVRGVRVVDDPWAELRGMRSPGVVIGKTMAVGTWRFPGGKDFVALHGRSAGVLVDLEGLEFARILYSSHDAAADVTWIDSSRRAFPF
jgi:hypothetical protein